MVEPESPRQARLGHIDKPISPCYPTGIMGEERRRTQRVRSYHPVRFSLMHSRHTVETLAKDLSTSGLRCLSPTLFLPETELHLEIVLCADHGPIQANGKVVWFRTIQQSEQFDIGIEFTDLNQKDKIRLSAYIDKI